MEGASETSTAVITSAEAFFELKDEWYDLQHAAPRATPFQTWQWLSSWWNAYGSGHELRIVTVRQRSELVGVLPLMLVRDRGLAKLMLIGTGITDYLDLLAKDGCEEPVVESCARSLEEMPSWHVADLQQIRPQANLWALADVWAGRQSRLPQDECLLVRVQPWDNLLQAMTTKRRRDARKALRRAHEDDVTAELAACEETEEAVHRLLELHREQWSGRSINAEHVSERFERHLATSVASLCKSSLGGVLEFRRGEEVIAASLVLFGRELLAEYLFGARAHAVSRYQVSALLMHDELRLAEERKCEFVTLLRGAEEYKLKWNPTKARNYRVLLGRSTPVFVGYASFHFLRAHARQYLRSERAPQWLKDAVSQVRR